MQQEGFSIQAQETDDAKHGGKEIFDDAPVLMREDILEKATNWFHVVEDEYREQIDRHI